MHKEKFGRIYIKLLMVLSLRRDDACFSLYNTFVLYDLLTNSNNKIFLFKMHLENFWGECNKNTVVTFGF